MTGLGPATKSLHPPGDRLGWAGGSGGLGGPTGPQGGPTGPQGGPTGPQGGPARTESTLQKTTPGKTAVTQKTLLQRHEYPPTCLLSDCRHDCNLRVDNMITSIYIQIADIDNFNYNSLVVVDTFILSFISFLRFAL